MSSQAFELKFADEVEFEMREIFLVYILRSPSIANSFIEALGLLLDLLNANPNPFPGREKISGSHTSKNFRRPLSMK